VDRLSSSLKALCGLRSREWLLSYKTSSTIVDGRPVDMLHDFYIPALSLSTGYDRVAGYFRSSSLAAASLGFSAFVGKHGHMRLIVGADLDTADVRAILNGDRERLERRLNDRLSGPEAWPQSVRDGVGLLAWMIANGYLEVRVAFRVHGATGEPVGFESVQDGYVHEKWFVLRDEYGNRLYGSGTLNESRTALVLNAENLDVHCDWHGERDGIRVDDAEASFAELWDGHVRHVPVLTLPEAVRKRLIQLAEDIRRPTEVDGTSEVRRVVEPPSTMDRLRFAVIKDAPHMPGGRFVGLYTAPIKPWPHQEIVVRRLVQTWPYSYLLCDEVGLGKTIEAGLAFRCLHLSGLVKRMLVAAPASLVKQWQREMASKLLLRFGRVLTGSVTKHEYIIPSPEEHVADSPYDPNLVIISTGVLVRRDRLSALGAARPFDLVLVDEAHALRRRNPVQSAQAHADYGSLYSATRDMLKQKTKSLWLATATPMQIDPVEICDLLALVGRVGAFQHDPTLTLGYYEILRQLVDGQSLAVDDWEFIRSAVKAVSHQDPLYWDFLEQSLIDSRIRPSARLWLDHGRTPRGRDEVLIRRLIYAASPLSRTMMRHTRPLLEIYHEKGQLGGNLARRTILPLPRITFTEPERQVYERLEKYCKGLSSEVANASTDVQTRHALGFLLSFVRLRFASSFYALLQTLKRRLAKIEATLTQEFEGESDDEIVFELAAEGGLSSDDEDDERESSAFLKGRTSADLGWERNQVRLLIEDLEGLTGPSSKTKAFLSVLDQRRDPISRRVRQTVVFTRFYDTLTEIVDQLLWLDPDVSVACYSGRGGAAHDQVSGGLVQIDRDKVKERFLRGEIDILVCTDAAAEGLNLQTADLLINYDLGWNPMKIEQRIGRIDRIGQKHSDVYVLNLCYAGSAEEIVYGRLLSRLYQANMIVGTQQVSLLPVTEDDFTQLAEKEITPEQLEEKAKQRLLEQRDRIASMELPPKDLYDAYVREAAARRNERKPVELNDILNSIVESDYLRNLGCIVSHAGEGPVVVVNGVEAVPDGTLMTTSQSLYEKGLKEEPGRMHFASYGDPCFDALLSHMNEFELPACAKRVSVTVPGLDDVEVVAYAVVCRNVSGDREVRHVQTWSDLESLTPSEDDAPSEVEIDALRKWLFAKACAEYRPHVAANQIEYANEQAALAQQILAGSVALGILNQEAEQLGGPALFWPAMKQVEGRLDDAESLLVEIEARLVRPIERHLVFDFHAPVIGDSLTATIPVVLARAAIHVAYRLADGMRERKSEQTIESVRNRLVREMRVLLGKLE
jgi:superfamily II DNA or RNA helicase